MASIAPLLEQIKRNAAESLDGGVFEGFGRLHAEGFGVRMVFVLVQFEGHFRLLDPLDCGRLIVSRIGNGGRREVFARR